MLNNNTEYQLYSFYNLARYLFLKLEYTYNLAVEKHNITLPQLRVLWIISCFPNISQDKIAKIGCWTPPTVSKMIKLLLQKNFIYKGENSNKKTHNLNLTENGVNIIISTKQNKASNISLLKLLNKINIIDLDFLSEVLKYSIVNNNKEYILDYIAKVNHLQLKIDLANFSKEEKVFVDKLISLYNLIRVFVLTEENNHSNLLSELNLTYPQLRALNILKAFPGINSTGLGKLGFWSKSTANLIVKNLYKKELIYKEKGSVKNNLHLYVSEKGQNILSFDIKNNIKNINIISSLKNLSMEKILYANSILKKMNCIVENHIVENFIIKSYESIDKFN